MRHLQSVCVCVCDLHVVSTILCMLVLYKCVLYICILYASVMKKMVDNICTMVYTVYILYTCMGSC